MCNSSLSPLYWKLFLFLLFTLNTFGDSFNEYWENIPYDKWNIVPKKEISIDINISITKEMLSFYIELYRQSDYIGILKANRYKKVHCDTESGDCGIYKSDVFHVFKGDEKMKKIIFEDDFTNSPDVYRNKAIYVLYKVDGMYYQDDFIQLDAKKKLIIIFDKLSKNRVNIYTSTYQSLYSFCKSTGIKESEIRALNPWINKKATNIPPNAEIIIPNINKEENHESK